MNQTDYARVAAIIEYLDKHFQEQPSLATLGAQVGLSEFHLQRLFKQWVGISPKRFLQFATAEHARQLLLSDESTLETAYAVGLSGGGRLHDLMINVHAMTPGEIKRGGAGLTLRHGFHETPFGLAFIATSPHGITDLRFIDPDPRETVLANWQAEWPAAQVIHAEAHTRPLVEQIFDPSRNSLLNVHLRGTNFQVRVWEALLNIPAGRLATYQQVAGALGMPRAARAVGNAVGHNRIAYLIPCHRVIRSSGAFAGYRWGRVRKQSMIAWEAARLAQACQP
ncbi:MAG: methylated-DNA--[protein]-cysteine S-methyltransferase [Anaerolineae bacterium]|nr:methylated-DNA--[protein]-cysteine S-methyltransferase [Anaerolineae bacterium]